MTKKQQVPVASIEDVDFLVTNHDLERVYFYNAEADCVVEVTFAGIKDPTNACFVYNPDTHERYAIVMTEDAFVDHIIKQIDQGTMCAFAGDFERVKKEVQTKKWAKSVMEGLRGDIQ